MGKSASLYNCPHTPATQVKSPHKAFILVHTGSQMAGSLFRPLMVWIWNVLWGCVLRCGWVAGFDDLVREWPTDGVLTWYYLEDGILAEEVGCWRHVKARCGLSSARLSCALVSMRWELCFPVYSHQGLLHLGAISKEAGLPRLETTNHETKQVVPPLSDARYFVVTLNSSVRPRCLESMELIVSRDKEIQGKGREAGRGRSDNQGRMEEEMRNDSSRPQGTVKNVTSVCALCIPDELVNPQRWERKLALRLLCCHHPLTIHSWNSDGNYLPVKHLVDATRDFKALMLMNITLGGLAGQVHSIEKDMPTISHEVPGNFHPGMSDCRGVLVKCVTLMLQAHLCKPASGDRHGFSLELLRHVVWS